MLCLESSFLIDWFRGQDYAREFLESRPPDELIGVPSVVLHEVFVGALSTGEYPSSITAVYQALEHTKSLPFTTVAAEEAAEIRVALADRGEQIGGFDSLIAGAARNADATLVTTDSHYTRVDDLTVLNPRDE